MQSKKHFHIKIFFFIFDMVHKCPNQPKYLTRLHKHVSFKLMCHIAYGQFFCELGKNFKFFLLYKTYIKYLEKKKHTS